METTLVPFASLPSCVANCGVLYDVNGACVPPAAATADAGTYDSCFCKDARLAAFSSVTGGPCVGACAATPDALGSVQGWFTSFCANQGAVQTGTTTGTSTSTGTSSPGSSNSGGGGGTWLSTHYQWVIFLVIVVVAIAGIWIGCCIWRRHYLRKRDRQYALGKRLAHATESGRVVPNASNAGSVHVPGAGLFNPAPLSEAGIYDEEKLAKKQSKKEKKKWNVTQRT